MQKFTVIKSYQPEDEDVDVACCRVVCDGSLAGRVGVQRDGRSSRVARYTRGDEKAKRSR